MPDSASGSRTVVKGGASAHPGARATISGRAWIRLLARAVAIAGVATLTVYVWGHDPARERAETALRERDYQSAVKWATASQSRHPTDSGSARIAAQALSELLYPDAAERSYDQLKRLGRFTLEDAQRRALGLTRANRRDEAVAAYESILRDHPDDPTALQRLAALQWLRGRRDEALVQADRLARTSTGAVAGHTIQAEVHHEAGRPREAIPHFRRVLELDPELRGLTQPRVLFHAEFGGDLLTGGLASEARELLEKATARDHDPGLIDLLGRACLDDGDPDAARRAWRRSSELAPERLGPWLHLGKLALKEGRPAEAAESFNRALALAPDHYEILANLAIAHRVLGHLEEARDFQARAATAQKALPPSTGGMGADAMPRSKPQPD